MTDYQIVGIEKVSYKNKENHDINGCKLYLTYTKKGIEGVACETVFVKNELAEGLVIGMSVYLLYNKYGRVAQINII